MTKGFGVDAVAAAAAAGIASIGENYAQELLTKLDAARAAGLAVHFIGRLQSNKVRQLAGAVAVWESIDRPALVAELARRAPGATVLVQVAATGEPGKGGCPPDEVPALVEQAAPPGCTSRADDGRADRRRPGGGSPARSASSARWSTTSACRRARWG